MLPHCCHMLPQSSPNQTSSSSSSKESERSNNVGGGTTISSSNSTSSSTSTNGSNWTTMSSTSSKAEGSDVKFQRELDSIKGFPNLTDELEKTGRITKYITKCPELQEYEYEKRLKLLKYKQESKHALKDFDANVDMIVKMTNPTELMETSIEDLIDVIEHSRNIKIESFEDLLLNMKNIQGSEIALVKTTITEINKPTKKIIEPGEEDLFTDELEEPTTPPQENWNNGTTLKKVGSTKVGQPKVDSFVFPTSREMTKNPEKELASPALFKFLGVKAPPSTNKAPRVAKPGETMLFSQSGSPVMLPRLPRVPAGIPERVQFTDTLDGKKIVEVVLYRGAQEKVKEYRDFVTDVRGLVATKSMKSNRVLPPRIPTRGGPASATKKPNTWHY